MRSVDFVSWLCFLVLVACIIVGVFDLIVNGFDGDKWMVCAAGAYMALIFDGSYHMSRLEPGEEIDWMDKFR